MKILLLLLLVGLVYLVARFALLAGRVRREAEQAFGKRWEARHQAPTGGAPGSSGRREKDISGRARIVEDPPTRSEQSAR